MSAKIHRHTITGRNIIRLKKQRKMTSTELAREVGIQTGRLSKLEKGEAGVSPAMEKKLCSVFNCDPAELYRPIDEEDYDELLKPIFALATEKLKDADLEKRVLILYRITRALREGD